jgi:arylsulfatase
MRRRTFIKTAGLGVSATYLLNQFIPLNGCGRKERKPNIILILADDLGYNELGCYGQEKIKTPHIDQLAKEGMRFTQFYSGSPVCAPSRSVLMTGKHTGHTFVRDNKEIGTWESFNGQLPLPEHTRTIAKLLKEHGYATTAIGKWGLGYPGSSGDPNKQGFDLFYGYNCQRHAHNYYPKYLWKNDKKITLEGNNRGFSGQYYAPDLMEEEALEFIRSNKDRPFFLYFATPVPHLALQVPDDSLQEYLGVWDDTAYEGDRGYLPHKYPRAAYAAMVTRMDRTVGRVVNLIKEMDLDEDTLIVFTSDNGPSYLGGYDREFFQGPRKLRCYKGYVYEGGIRVPLIAHWPKKIESGRISDQIGAFEDILPTFLDLIGKSEIIPNDIDGISLAPTFLEQGEQKEHEYLYMEFPAYGGQQMLRQGKWKAVRQNLIKEPDAPIELYNLEEDVEEKQNLADMYPKIIEELWINMKKARTKSSEFPFPALDNQIIPSTFVTKL